MDISFDNFNRKYAKQIENLESSYWGNWEDCSIIEEQKNYDLFLIILINNCYAGHLYGNYIGNLFYFDTIIIKDEYRNKGLGTKLLNKTIELVKEKNIKNIITTAEHLKDNTIPLSPVLNKLGFQEVIDIKGLWGNRYPEIKCNMCGFKPCKCIATLYLKKL